jgi:hypothetical protein
VDQFVGGKIAVASVQTKRREDDQPTPRLRPISTPTIRPKLRLVALRR